MKTFDTLYKRTRTGAIQFWKISVGLATNPTIYKESGQLGTTSPVQHKEEIKEGKNIGKANETKPAEQAVSQAQSDWTRKHDEGYKSLKDLKITSANDDYCWHQIMGAADVPYYGTLSACLEQSLPQFNTDASGNVKPMLAKDWAGGKKVKYPCYIQPKLDGVRCLMVIDINDEGPLLRFLSRSGKDYVTLGHIGADILEYLAKAKPLVSFILDGEIYSDELTFQEITQAVKKQYPNSLKLHFRSYDIVNEWPQIQRLVALNNLVSSIGSAFIHIVPTNIADKQEDVKRMHDDWVQRGYEGAMIRHTSGIYAQGQRSTDLLKVKEFQEDEFDFQYWEFGQRQEDLLAVCKTG